jgi:hypothetical protein
MLAYPTELKTVSALFFKRMLPAVLGVRDCPATAVFRAIVIVVRGRGCVRSIGFLYLHKVVTTNHVLWEFYNLSLFNLAVIAVIIEDTATAPFDVFHQSAPVKYSEPFISE